MIKRKGRGVLRNTKKPQHSPEAVQNKTDNGLYKMLQREDDYMISGLLETIREMEDDVDSRSESFFFCADGVYRDYRAEIEKAAEELGKTLSDGDLERLGLVKAA